MRFRRLLPVTLVGSFLLGCGARTDLEVSPTTEAASPKGCVLFGGASMALSALDDTWLWDGSGWTKVAGATIRHEGIGRAARLDGDVFLFVSANTTAAATVDTFRLTGTSWSKADAVQTPPPRINPAVATLDGSVLLFGGITADGQEQALGDTWLWDGESWSERHPGTSPSPRAWASMAVLGDKILLFGGAGPTGALGDTWLWDGGSWSELHPAARPSARSGAAATALDGKVLLFGGCEASAALGCIDGGTDVADTWQFDGVWTELHPAASPPARDTPALGTLGSKAVLFGGLHVPDRSAFGDTWVFDGSTWTRENVPGPRKRWVPAMACD